LGRLAPQKNPQLLLSAFALAAGSTPWLRLLFVGEGPLRPELERLASSLDVSDRIVWCGWVDAAEALPAFDIFALPSCWESLSYAVLEAMASGLPVVATDAGGTMELIKDREAGYVVPAEDIGGFADALSELGRNAELRAVMGASAAAASSQFDVCV